RLHDPLESELPDFGLTVVQDAETGEQIFVDTHDRRFPRPHAAAAGKRERAVRASFLPARAGALELSTDEDMVDPVLRFTALRKRRNLLAAVSGMGAPA